ncbi:bifunctional diguanylate cyclase/phosphodiesterase [Clostridiales bacterium COT073_COT-073]|nr:bifunctional diguanylate cyclase/phosphodiesterase [Clostridiales bacterium COT073_COT-073]
MKRSLSLRTKIIFLMTFLVILQNISLVMSLSLSRVFYMLDAEAFRLFNNTTYARMQTINQEIAQLILNVADETRSFSQSLQDITITDNVEMDIRKKLYNQVAIKGSSHLINLLQNNSISGAFFMIESNSKMDLPSVYIRNSTPKNYNARPENFLIEVGPISVSQNYNIPTSVHWNINFPFDLNDPDLDYYHRPMKAAFQFPRVEMERYGYWTNPTNILPNSQPAVFYTMPLLEQNGSPIGVLGIEISLNHFSQYYLPLIDLPYQDSFYIITQAHDHQISSDWFISSGPLAHIYLPEDENLSLVDNVAADNIFTSYLEGLGEVYCFVQPLTIYSRNSPFIENSWHLVSFVPSSVLHEGSSNVRATLTISIIITTLLSILSIFLLAYVSTRKISGLSKYIASLNPYQNIHFKQTGMKEIDELTSAVDRLNQNIIQASKTTSKFLELSLLPIGGFELKDDSDQVVVTEYIYELLGIKPHTAISKAEWKSYYADLTALPESENIYQFSAQYGSALVWLRILESNTSTGRIGVIMDVTKEVEEHRRLTHELDFDNMTHLYNRKAFKREAHAKIMHTPDKIGVMIFSDLDNLKYINDTFGHDAGDRLILQASEMFNQFREHGGIVSRISGDEFATYLHGFSSKEEARRLIKKQLRQNESYVLKTPDGAAHRIRSSSGMAWYPSDSDNITDLLKLSDFAMYEAKHKEKGTLFEFNQESYRTNAYLLENREAIHRLIDERLIHFCFQPIICLRTGTIYAYEALMRPSLSTFKTPIEILAVAAAQSQLAQLERLVVSHAMETIEQHQAELADIRIFINSIPSHMLSKREFNLLKKKYGHLFSKVVLEVTERESDTLEQMSARLASIRKAGVKLALDDFGNGYSGEVRILEVNPNIVKIDMGLIQGIHRDPDKEQLVANLISFCHARDILLVAEGVEEQADLIKIIELDVDLVQGYYTGRPALKFEAVQPEVKAEILNLRRKYHANPQNKL